MRKHEFQPRASLGDGQIICEYIEEGRSCDLLPEDAIHTMVYDTAVDHPAHYGGDVPYEPIKVIMEWKLGFNLGNAVKYIARAGKKDPDAIITDLKKARFYLDYEIQLLEGTRER